MRRSKWTAYQATHGSQRVGAAASYQESDVPTQERLSQNTSRFPRDVIAITVGLFLD